MTEQSKNDDKKRSRPLTGWIGCIADRKIRSNSKQIAQIMH